MLQTKRVRCFLFLLLLLCLASQGEALRDGEKVSDPGEKAKILEEIKSLQKGIESISATVSQEKHLSLLKNAIHIKGKIILKRPALLRWEVSGPERTITVVNSSTMTVYRPQSREAEVYDLQADIIANRTVRFFTSFMWGNLQDIEREFTLNIYRNSAGRKLTFELIPKNSMARRYLSSIVIQYDTGTGLPRTVEIETPKGDRTITRLEDIKVNPEIAEDAFSITLPSDVWIINRIEDEENRTDGCCY